MGPSGDLCYRVAGPLGTGLTDLTVKPTIRRHDARMICPPVSSLLAMSDASVLSSGLVAAL
jgi:hypothetical protein